MLTSKTKNEWGAGIDGNTVKASFQAIISGINKLITWSWVPFYQRKL